MNAARRIARLVVVLGLVATAAVGSLALIAPVEAKGPCICPQIYAPVVCDNGKTYPNPCVAECRNGRNCVPADIF